MWKLQIRIEINWCFEYIFDALRWLQFKPFSVKKWRVVRKPFENSKTELLAPIKSYVIIFPVDLHWWVLSNAWTFSLHVYSDQKTYEYRCKLKFA